MPAPRKKKTPPATLGRYLRKFTLQNVRTFRSPVTLDFCHADGTVAQWTVILGENGTGKTTLLQYLAGMMPTDRLREKPSDRGREFWGPTLLTRSWHEWHAANVCGDLLETVSIEAVLTVSSAGTVISAAKEDSAIPKIFLRMEFSPGARIRGAYGSWSQWKEAEASHLRIFAYGASRHVAGASSPYIGSESFFTKGGADATRTLYHDDHPLISPEQWLLGLDHASNLAGKTGTAAKRAFDSAKRCLMGALAGLHDITVKPLHRSGGQSVMTLVFKTPYGEVPFSALSVGYRTMAAWLTDFIKRMHEAFPEMEEPENGPAVVLIDEFDLHMHPKWQREAMAALSKEFPNTQFIVTAHSPLVVQATEGNARIIVLRRKERADGTEEVEVINEPHYAAGWRVDQILASDLYDLPPRSPKFAALMEERIRLRQKEKRSKADEKRLAEIEQTLDAEAPPESAPETDKLLAKLGRALDRAEAKQRK